MPTESLPAQSFEDFDTEQSEANQEVLRSAELGVILEDAYITAINLDPRLSEDMTIIPITDKDDPRIGYATPKWGKNNESGKHEIHVRLDDLSGTLKKYDETMQALPAARDIISERLGVDPSQVTPQLVYVQSILHEMGHIREFMDNEADPAALQQRRKAEFAALPIGNVTAGALIAPDSKARQYVDAEWDRIHATLGFADMDELVNRQAHEYRNMTSEAVADGFASDVFIANPQMYDQLMSPDLENYVNFPQAA